MNLNRLSRTTTATAVNVTVGTMEESAHVAVKGAASIDGAEENINVVLDNAVVARIVHMSGARDGVLQRRRDCFSVPRRHVPRRPSLPSQVGA